MKFQTVEKPFVIQIFIKITIAESSYFAGLQTTNFSWYTKL